MLDENELSRRNQCCRLEGSVLRAYSCPFNLTYPSHSFCMDALLPVYVDIKTGYPPIEPRMLFQALLETATFAQNCGQAATLEHPSAFNLSSGSFGVNPNEDIIHDHPIHSHNSVRSLRKQCWPLRVSADTPALYNHRDVRLDHQGHFRVPAGCLMLDGGGQVRLENSSFTSPALFLVPEEMSAIPA